MRIHLLQHVPFEGPGRIADWARRRGHAWAISHPYAGEPLPGLERFDRLILMGGPMGVADLQAHPWLAPEKALIASAIEAGRSVVGICLGAQLIADVLGAKVGPNPQKEIGWFPIRLTEMAKAHPFCRDLPTQLRVLHWHGDTFALPTGAVPLAESNACAQQGFLAGDRVLGLQFHLEMTPETLQRLCRESAHELPPATQPAAFIQGESQMLAAPAEDYERTAQVLDLWLDRLPI